MVKFILQKYKIAQSRAFKLLELSRSTYTYESVTVDDSEIQKILNELVDEYKRYGFRKLFHMIRRRGYSWNHKRVYRVYRSLGLNLRKKPKKRLPIRDKVTLMHPIQPNVCWSLDYMSDALVYGKRFRTINVLDDYNREGLAVKAHDSLPAKRVIEELEFIGQERGFPKKIRVDNGPENISKDFKKWATARNIEIEYIQPGKPAQNDYIERFNRTYREEVLDLNLFRNLEEVQKLTDRWLHEYNTIRPHQSLGNLTPREYGACKNFSIFGLH